MSEDNAELHRRFGSHLPSPYGPVALSEAETAQLGQEHELLSAAGSSAAELFAARPRGHRPAVIADANALIADSIRRSRGLFSLMPFLAEHRLIRLVAAAHIDEKVHARLPDACKTTRRADLGAATHVYETFHRPLLRLVQVGDLMLNDERVGAVALADAEDVPVAQLGVLLAPSLVLTRDPHLLDAGIGVQQWADALVVLKELVELDQMMWAGADGVMVSGALTIHGIGGLVRLLSRSELALGIVLGLALGLGYRFRHELREAPAKLREGNWPALERLLAQMALAFERWEDADNRVRPSLVRPTTTESLEAVVARALLQCIGAVPAAEVHRRLPYPWQEGVTVEQVKVVLREQPAFELTRGRGWTLGHAPRER